MFDIILIVVSFICTVVVIYYAWKFIFQMINTGVWFNTWYNRCLLKSIDNAVNKFNKLAEKMDTQQCIINALIDEYNEKFGNKVEVKEKDK